MRFNPSTPLYFLSRDLTNFFFLILLQPFGQYLYGFHALDRGYSIRLFSCWPNDNRSSTRSGTCDFAHFFKSMNWLTKGLADDEHGLIFILETSSLMSRWFQPSKQSPSTRKMSMKDTAHTVCTWISSTRKVFATSFSRDRRALRNMTPRKGSIRSVDSFSS